MVPATAPAPPTPPRGHAGQASGSLPQAASAPKPADSDSGVGGSFGSGLGHGFGSGWWPSWGSGAAKPSTPAPAAAQASAAAAGSGTSSNVFVPSGSTQAAPLATVTRSGHGGSYGGSNSHYSYYGGPGSSGGSGGSGSYRSDFASDDTQTGSGSSSSHTHLRYQPANHYGSTGGTPASTGAYYQSDSVTAPVAMGVPREPTLWERYGSAATGGLSSMLIGSGAASLCRYNASKAAHSVFDVCVLRNLQTLAWSRGLSIKLRGQVSSAAALTPVDHALTQALPLPSVGRVLDMLTLQTSQHPRRLRGSGAIARTGVVVSADSVPAAAAMAAREMGRAAQPKLAQAIAAQGFMWTAPAVALCCLGTAFSRKESTGRDFAGVGSLLAVPLLAIEAHAATQGYMLLRGMGMPRLAAARTFCGVPPLLALVAAPLVGHFAKKYAGGYSQDV